MMVEAGSLVSSKSELARKEKLKKKSKSGGFESLNLSPNVYRAIRRIGYKVPTPIQRKALPLILSGSDVVAMARTGSGKTAAFLIPIIERLKQHLPQNGVRALVLSPTRDLALQTLKFTKDLGRFTDIRTSLIVGGDSMDNQFEELSNSPDIIIATPGRLMHHLVEVDDMSLKSVECVVFDEADSLFDMGFAEQLHQILSKLGDNRQTLLFSATLPSALADFAKAGLKDPKLIRLDVETKISPDLKTTFFALRQEEKLSALLYLMREIISPQEQTLIFVSTKHHVELLSSVFKSEDIEASVSYGDMDQAARKMHVSKFRARKSMHLIVTDVAARGIDIPLLDNVINWDFPPKPKIFVHRVGRVARAGRRGAAFSFVTSDDMPYLLDLHLFLSKPIMAAPSEDEVLKDFDGVMSVIEEKIAGGQTVYGRLPQSLIDLISDRLRESIEASAEISTLVRTCANAFRLYTKTKPPPSKESIRRVKELPRAGVHPLFKDVLRGGEILALAFSQRLKSFRPKQTILEAEGDTGPSKKHKDSSVDIMAKKRAAHDELINNTMKQQAIKNAEKEADNATTYNHKQKRGVKRKQESFKDEDNYISQIPANHFTEIGLSVKSNEFGANRLESAVLDLVADDSEGLQKQKSQYHWDKKSKKYIKLNNGDRVTATGKIKSESGSKVKAQKVGLYKKWKERSHKKISEGGSEETSYNGKYRGHRKHQKMVPNGNLKSEIKDLEQIRKERQKKERRYSNKKEARKNKNFNKAARGKRK